MSLPFGDYKIVFVDEMLNDYHSFASLTLASVNLLHSQRVIDQTLLTRQTLGMAIAAQYFGVFIVPESFNDSWLVVGIKHILFLLFLKKIHGNNECRFWVYEQLMKVYKAEHQQLLPPLHLKDKSQSYPLTTGNHAYNFHMDPTLTPPHVLELLELKSMLIMRMIENRLGDKVLLQNVVKKLLSLAWTNPTAGLDRGNINALLSTQDFLKTIQVVSGKDITDFMSQYVYRPGFSNLHFSFAFNRKRNLADITIKQKPLHDGEKFVGQLTVLVQEIDGSFSNIIQVEKNDAMQELNCQSKSRRNKKKKIPLFTGEEVEIDLSHNDQVYLNNLSFKLWVFIHCTDNRSFKIFFLTISNIHLYGLNQRKLYNVCIMHIKQCIIYRQDSPVIWMRIDPEMLWLCKINLQMPDFMWNALLLHERDVVYQHKAAEILPNFSSHATITTLSSVILNNKCYYKVRIQAVYSLAKCISISGILF